MSLTNENEAGIQLLKHHFPEMTDQQLQQFGRLGELYGEWNEKINVISRKDIGELYERHVLHSLAIAKVIRFSPGSTILDVGTGGGFPGIPLAILFPDVQFLLIDSIGKKIKVVEAVAESIGLTNLRTRHQRVQEIKQKFDFVVSRAVTAFPEFVAMVRKNISPVQRNGLPNGIIYLKGGDFTAELQPFGQLAELFDIPSFYNTPFFETKKVIYLPVR